MSENQTEPLFTKEFLDWSDQMSEIMDCAVKKAIEENRRLGLTTGGGDEPAPVEAESSSDDS